MINVKNKSALLAALAAGAVGLLAGTVISGDAQQMSQEEMMQKWMEMNAPGEVHAEMQQMAGNWNSVNTYWAYPGAEPSVSNMKATIKPIMGGRYMLETVKGTMNMGDQKMPMEGMNIMAYDNMKQKHMYCWIDNYGTGLFIGEGEEKADGSIVFMSEMMDPMSGEMVEMKSIARHNSKDDMEFEMYRDMGGSWFKEMHIHYTRAN